MATPLRPRPAFTLQSFPFVGLVGAALLALAGLTVAVSQVTASTPSAVESLPVVTSAAQDAGASRLVGSP